MARLDSLHELNMCLRILLLRALFYFSTYTSSQLKHSCDVELHIIMYPKLLWEAHLMPGSWVLGPPSGWSVLKGHSCSILPQKVFGAEMCPVPPRDLGLGNGHEGQGFGVPLELFHRHDLQQNADDGDHFGMKDSLGVLQATLWKRSSLGDFPSHFNHTDVAPNKGPGQITRPSRMSYYKRVNTVHKGRPRKRKSPGPGADLAAYNAGWETALNLLSLLDYCSFYSFINILCP